MRMSWKSIFAAGLVLAAGSALAASPAENPEHGMKDRVAACSSCHGKHGQGNVANLFPRLAGQPSQYLFKQLQDFQLGKRQFGVMERIVEGLPDAYLEKMAHYFSALKAPYPARPLSVNGKPIVSNRELMLGQILVTRGRPEEGLPACTTCHGAQLDGRPFGSEEVMTPALAGQLAGYTAEQLQAWQNGVRTNDPLGVMRGVAERLDQKEVNAVSDYLASIQPGQVQRAPQSYAVFMGQGPGEGQPTTPAEVAEQTAQFRGYNELAARGSYLAVAGDCASCHTQKGSEPYAGGRPIETPYGPIYTPNITPDVATGIGGWTEEDFWHALHDGIAPGHQYLYPAFPFPSYTNVTREDARALWAFLRSLQPIHKKNKPAQLRKPFNLRWTLFFWRELYFKPGVYKENPAWTGQWNRGAYLVKGLGHCSACHTPRTVLGGSKASEFLGGGSVEQWIAPGINAYSNFGIGDWSIDQIVEFLRTGQVKGKTAALGPMKEVIQNSLQYLTQADLTAIAVYLKSVVPAQPEQPATPSPGGEQPEPAAAGQPIYKKYCSGCHQDNGEGKPGIYPPLKGNPVVTLGDPANAITTVLQGGFKAATKADPMPYSMPPFAHSLSNKQIAAVVSYIRSSWGNKAPGAAPTQVEKLR